MRPVNDIATALKEKLIGIEAVFDAAPVGLCVLNLAFRYTTVNACFARMYGLNKEDFIGRTVEEALPGPAPQILLHLREALDADGIVEREITLHNPAPDRDANSPEEVIYLRTAQPIRNDQGTVYGITVALLDITARKQAETDLREAEDDLRWTLELTPHIRWTSDAAGELTSMSPRWNTITGTAGAVRLKEWAEVLHPEDLPATSRIWSKSIATGEPYDAEYRIRCADGSWRWVRARAYPRRNQDGEIIRWYGTVEDVNDRRVIGTQLLEATRELSRLAQEDHLTGLPNRRRFDDAISREIRRARRSRRPTALILLDIDHFKQYNDLAGHLAGDECLQAIARTIDSVIRRPGDLAARFGGEEFVILLPETGLEGAMEIAHRALAAVRQLRFDHADRRIQKATISAGIAVHPGGELPMSANTMTDLIQAADTSLYKAKADGRDRAVSVVLD